MLKTIFLTHCSQEIGLNEKKMRRLFDIGLGRYWQLEKGQKNAFMVRKIQNGNLAPHKGAPICEFKKSAWQTPENVTPEKTSETLPCPKLGNLAKDLCQFTKQTRIAFEGDLKGGLI